MSDIILCDIADVNSVISEARNAWIIDVLLGLEVPEDVIEAGFSDSDNYNNYVLYMNEIGVDVETDSSGCVYVYKKSWIDGHSEDMSGWLPPTKDHMVAHWKPPKQIRRISKDRKEVYYELHLEEWSAV